MGPQSLVPQIYGMFLQKSGVDVDWFCRSGIAFLEILACFASPEFVRP